MDEVFMEYFDRQERIAWWNQKTLNDARVLVIGAGALGNEVLKNLALTGIGRIVVVDFDNVEDSNLSRAVLFRMEDVVGGESKVDVAAKRAKELNPNPNAFIHPIFADVVWEVGLGVFRHSDIVLGCLDNLEARMAVNKACMLLKKTWIDGGMWEISGSVTVFDSSHDKACYECSMTSKDKIQASKRYSCTSLTVRTKIKEGYEPTTQITSAIIAGLQSQEAIKLLHGLDSYFGHRLVFNGAPHFYNDPDLFPVSLIELPVHETCLVHMEEELVNIHEVRSLTTNMTLLECFQRLQQYLGLEKPMVDLGRDFIKRGICNRPGCNYSKKFDLPLFQILDIDATCPSCQVICPTCKHVSQGVPDCPNCNQESINQLYLVSQNYFDLDSKDTQPYLNYTLAQLGVPPLHIIKVWDKSNEIEHIVELTGDLDLIWS